VFVKENQPIKGAQQTKVEGIDAFKNATKSRVVKRSIPEPVKIMGGIS